MRCCSCRRTHASCTSSNAFAKSRSVAPFAVLPPDLPGLSSRDPTGCRCSANQVLPATGLVDDAEFPAIRRRLTDARVRYNPLLASDSWPDQIGFVLRFSRPPGLFPPPHWPLFPRHSPFATIPASPGELALSGSPGLSVPRQSGSTDPEWVKLVFVPASGIGSPRISRPRTPGIGFVSHKEIRINRP